MKRFYHLIIAFLFIIPNLDAQNNFSYEEVVSEPSTITFSRNLVKSDLQYRMGNGATTFILDFEGDLWDEDSKGAVKYACQLLEEYLSTAYPIRIKARRDSRLSSPLATTTVRTLKNGENEEYVSVPINISSEVVKYKLPTATMKRHAITGAAQYRFFEENEIFDSFDGTIIYSPQDIFSHRIDGNVEAGKYDMVTVTLREIARILGFHTSIKYIPGTTILNIFDEGHITPYSYRIFSQDIIHNNANFYNYAISGNAYLGHDSRPEYSYKLYSPRVFNERKSLLYFEENPNNQETLLLQPELPKQTSITKIGKGMLDALNLTGWDAINEGISIIGDGYKGIQYTGSTATPVNGKISFNNNNPRNSRILTLTEIEELNNARALSQNRSMLNIKLIPNSFKYKHFEKDGILTDIREDGSGLMGWAFYLIKKDGTLDKIASNPDEDINFFEVNLSSIKDFEQYARTSDGYLRGRLNCNKYHESPYKVGGNYLYNYVQHIYINYAPPKPKLAIKNNFLRSSTSNPGSYYKDIDLAFSNIAGATSGTIIQKEYDRGREYTNSYHVNIPSGTYIATVDKELKTTFQLVIQNALGVSYSDIITIYPEDTYNAYSLNLAKSGDILEINFKDQNQFPVSVEIASGKIFNISNSNILPIKTHINQINIRQLPAGVYGITITDKNNNTYNSKFIK